jgi:hypothetical protein
MVLIENNVFQHGAKAQRLGFWCKLEKLAVWR